MAPRIRSIGRLIVKLSLSAVALYIVFQNIDSQQLLALALSANPLWILAALVTYNLSKVLSSFRLTFYFRSNRIPLSESDNLRLYYVGMFYNLFLPGGIGGDAYKMWILHRDHGVSAKKAFQSLLFDRLSGFMLLAGLGCLFGWIAFPDAPWRNLLLVALVSVLPATYFLHLIVAKHFLPIVRPTAVLSLGVQGLQVLCAWLLLVGIGIHDNTFAYLTVFLISSLVAVLPISVGGIGIRELVFITAASFSAISKDASVTFSLMFFAVTALSALPGVFLRTQRTIPLTDQEF